MFMGSPDIHGDQIVFVSEGDLWLGDLATRSAKRITRHDKEESTPRFSPDGKQVAFTALYDGPPEVYTMDATSGEPRRMSFGALAPEVADWSSDGGKVRYTQFEIPIRRAVEIPALGGVPAKVPLEYISHLSSGPKPGQIAFTRNHRSYEAWFNYIGGMQNQIWTGDLATKRFAKLTNVPGTNEFPHWLGERIYFVNEVDGRFSLMSIPAGGGKANRHLGPLDVEIRNLQGDGKRIVYEKGPGIEVFDPVTGKATPVTFQVNSDLIHTRAYSVAANANMLSATPTPTGKRAFVEARGQILSLAAGEGEARVWKSIASARLRFPTMAPDGKHVAYFSDESGEMAVHLADSDGANAVQLTHGIQGQFSQMAWSPDSKWIGLQTSENRLLLVDAATGAIKEIAHHERRMGTQFEFSPDSKWIAFINEKPVVRFDQLFLYEIATGKTTQVSDGRAEDRLLAWSPDGRYLAIASDRNLQFSTDFFLTQWDARSPSIVSILVLQKNGESPLAPKDSDEGTAPEPKTARRVDLDGLYERRVELPMPAGEFANIQFAGSRLLMRSGNRITFFDLATKATGLLTTGAWFQTSADGKKVLVGDGTTLRMVDSTGADIPATAGAIAFGGLTLTVHPRQEWRQIYFDAWRLLRDNFYVENMHGVNWTAMRDKYAAYLPWVRSRDEVDILIRWLQAELGCSHQFQRPPEDSMRDAIAKLGRLGVDLEAGENGSVRISRILRGDGYRTSERSPLLGPGLNVKEGDYILEVAGTPARADMDFMRGLSGRVGQLVSIRVNDKPSTVGARTIKVKPVSAFEEMRMRDLDWVESNRRYVEKASEGKVGYVYLFAMTDDDMADFVKQYYAQRDKEAMLIDVRYNQGGRIQEHLNTILSRKVRAFWKERGMTQPWTRQWDFFMGPKACLINEFAISCGEEFPDRFRDLKIGPLIGMRTMGGEVGSAPAWPLIDGGAIQVPRYGMYNEEGWMIEGEGVKPDIEVPSDPNQYVLGKDPQLDAGVKYLLGEIAKRPYKIPAPPKDRVRTKSGTPPPG
jgi:tricorn protease